MPLTLQERIAQAEAARYDLISGRAAVELRMGNELVKFQPGDRAALDRHIDDLKAAAGLGRRRAIGVRFR